MRAANHVSETAGSVADELDGRERRLALTEISVRLSVISQDLIAPRVSVDDLCNDVNDLTAAIRRLHRIAENVQRNARESE
jgi:methyl-accepting chemotaxis protein